MSTLTVVCGSASNSAQPQLARGRGPSRTALPRLLDSLPRVDLFFHDDLHTPDHMLWEYELVWPKMRAGGVLASDDVNHGWIEFCRRQGFAAKALNNLDRFCAVRKQ